MGLNIKNERVHALAREAAARTGLSQTGAIERALEDLLRSLRTAPDRRTRLDVLFDEIDERLHAAPQVGIESADLYDELGLPR